MNLKLLLLPLIIGVLSFGLIDTAFAEFTEQEIKMDEETDETKLVNLCVELTY